MATGEWISFLDSDDEYLPEAFRIIFDFLLRAPQDVDLVSFTNITKVSDLKFEEGSIAVAYEALSCGVPVIASTNAGVSHIVRDGENGFIVPVRDVDAIEEKLKFLYDNRGILAQMSSFAREDMVKNHSYEKYAFEMINTYEKLV